MLDKIKKLMSPFKENVKLADTGKVSIRGEEFPLRLVSAQPNENGEVQLHFIADVPKRTRGQAPEPAKPAKR